MTGRIHYDTARNRTGPYPSIQSCYNSIENLKAAADKRQSVISRYVQRLFDGEPINEHLEKAALAAMEEQDEFGGHLTAALNWLDVALRVNYNRQGIDYDAIMKRADETMKRELTEMRRGH